MTRQTAEDMKKNVQDTTDKYVAKIDEACAKKEKELMEL